MRPSLAGREPLMIENSVVLPAPFGPISAVMRPASAANDARAAGSRPPKSLDTCSTRSRGSAIALLHRLRCSDSLGSTAPAQVVEDAGDAARRERHDQNQNAAINDEVEAGRIAGHELGDLAQGPDHERAEQRT